MQFWSGGPISCARLFGWGAYLFALSIALLGLRLVWRDMSERVPFGTASIVGLELLFLVILVLSHAPLVLRSGADEAWIAATQGQGGGYVGWALAVLLIEGLGVAVGGLIVLAAVLAAIYLILTPWWGQIYPWGRHQFRRAVAGVNRWLTSRQGTPSGARTRRGTVVGEGPAARKKARRRNRARKATKRTKAKPHPADGSLPTVGSIGFGLASILWGYRRSPQDAHSLRTRWIALAFLPGLSK